MFSLRSAFWLVGLFVFFGCAQQVAPTGGPKDETPPKILEQIPSNLSTNFSGNRIEIAFDEFVQLKSPSEQIIISPPLAKQPNYQLKKKSLIIKFEQQLAENTTYTINFGEAIRDNNEGNILANFTYVFSTGLVLDSMQLKGKLVDALTGEPEEGALVMLYKNDIDSLPIDTTPDYFTRSDESGRFTIKNIANQKYKIFALQDENANYKFDVPTEKIGFLDSLVEPYFPLKPAVLDTVSIDSTQTDSLSTEVLPDSSVTETEKLLESAPIQDYEMRMFVEEDTTQFLKKSYCDYFGKFIFVYNKPVQTFDVNLLGLSFKKQWNLVDISQTQDTVTIWVTDLIPDTVTFIVSPNSALTDTVELVMKSLEEASKPKKSFGKTKKQPESFELKARISPNNRSPKPGNPLLISWSHPILGMDISRMKLYEDSLRVLYDIQTQDPALCTFEISYEWKKDKKYRLLILDSAFTDMYDFWNDTIESIFTGTDKDAFGSLSLKIKENPAEQIIVELVNSAGKIIGREITQEAGLIQFKQLDPGNYNLDLITDLNRNGKWDSGRYSEKTQPEPIRVLQSNAEVRQNWDLELEWDPNENQ